ncbi:hypothetical protein [Neolewinella maritima]|uniref:hypothetical protein n=1 Tax=Neolewinella maritima TaxID=1383882 RepID=UPI001EE90B85|nr:hypothetical protein [Neolewinella maritima]
MTFTEYKPADFSLAPQRNPLGEIRWWKFLGGAAYTNPLHDLLYALSRSSEPRPTRDRRQLRFEDHGLAIVQAPPGETQTYTYAELTELHLDYTCFPRPDNHLAGGSFFLRLSLCGSDIDTTIDLRSTHSQCQQVIKLLYARRVRFREYYMGSRSYLLEPNIPYQRVQQLKADYGIEW